MTVIQTITYSSIQLVLHEKGFFRYKSTVLHGGEGAISTIRWRSCYIAWANDLVCTLLLRELLSIQLIPVLVSCAPNLFCFNFLGCQSV
jgi:hypothetical protein